MAPAHFVQRTEVAPGRDWATQVVVARKPDLAPAADPLSVAGSPPAAGPAPAADLPAAAEPAPPAQAAPARAGAPAPAGQEPEELLKKLYDPLLRRLKAELWLDRERRGVLTDRWH
ncbi:pyruvate/2-oxoglutarate dehydrogenase complex dihydrolipoamide acyltransferase (E2) component [Saccharothrix tamanrassetensis]|uniref:Pyruvate/2-oxoglutarate dehydrogenase complex dihydrolipoamide acyltransferase (E2) component n=1 Tax=Saccharothrix tamanrassetensis TaxID=1051531 RepID=A0A841CTL2_9PSEU|nr:hypothetical protein [Saccharothrix tamanrassetensis]MBB5959295.1 pyruvate/2-oxoglutarate dehydrogenase complex dihydrolipoamide acyltransferase (E2) component [Saccharothrix tamanrassetensis]